MWLDSARAGFAALLPPDHEWPSAERVAWSTLAALEGEGVGFLLADGPDGPIGFVGHGPSRDPDALTGVGEIRTMFVLPVAWGTGVGGALIEGAFERLRAGRYAEATVWSFLANERANAFYEKHGMKRDGARRREAVWAELDQVRFRRELSRKTRRDYTF